MPLKGLKGGSGVKPLGYGLGAAETEETEPNFNETVLLLHADGSEGEGNTAALGDPNYKAFRDNSTSVHAITVNGDAYGNDFSPYYYADGYWSVAFDEASDIQIAHSSEFNAGTGAFTLEGFVYVSSKTNYTTLYSQGYTNAGGILIQTDNNTSGFRVFIDTSNRFTLSEINLNEWVHIAIVRDGSGNLAGYINGVQNQTATGVTDDLNNTSVVQIGKGSTSHYLDGYISNLRFIKGTAKYQATSGASNFTVPTTPFTDESGTSFLVCQSNRFMDNSTTGHTLTTSGAPKVSTNTPFTQSKTANVGSGFFDGTGDGLTTATSSDFAFGTNNFTFECWVYPSSDSGTQVILDLRDANNGDTDHMSALVWQGDKLDCFSGTNFASGTDLGNYFFANSWNHVAVQRSGNTLYHSVNGIVSSTNPSFTRDLTANGLATIGGNVGLGTSMFTGYIADMRIVNGTAVYGTSNFTVPTSSLTAVTNTKLLTTQYSGAVRNVGLVDDSKYNHQITRNGNVHMGTFSPFSLEDGYWSNLFDASGDYFTIPASSDFNFGTGQFTIELFVYFTNSVGAGTLIGQSGFGSVLQLQASGYFQYYDINTASYLLTGGVTASKNTWTHVVVQRDASNNLDLFVNGTRQATTTSTATLGFTNAQNLTIHSWNGNISPNETYYSNIRIIKGSSVYTSGSSITVPTTPLTAVSGTELLTCQSNRFKDNSTTGRTITASGNPKVLPFSPFAPSRSYSKDAVGGSAFFDGTGDSLKIEPQNDKDVFNPTTTYTVEGWLYVNIDSPGTRHFLTKGGTGAGWGAATGHYFIMFYYSGSVYVQIKKGTSSLFGISAAHGPSYQWNHFAVGYDGSTTRFWWNGQSLGSSGDTPVADTATNGDQMYLGVSNDGSTGHWPGYISNVRYVRGTDIYGVDNTSITVPTSPPTAVTNTNFLTTFTNAGIIDHTMKNNFETVGNTRISTIVKKFGTGSIYFDGNDALQYDGGDGLAIRTGAFTVEFFVYFDGDPNSGGTNGRASLVRSIGTSSGNMVIQRYDGDWRVGTETSPQIIATQSLSNQTWYHVAMARDASNNLKLFIDGTQAGSTATSFTQDFPDNDFFFGNFSRSGGSSRALTGYLDEIRITKGIARYTSNFTAPTQAFPDR